MIDSTGRNLIFLLCPPRSGSSLVTFMLQNHKNIFATQEMWFLMSLYDTKHPARRAYGGEEIMRQFYQGVLPDDVFVHASRSYALEVYNGLLQSSKAATMIVDKSPRYYYNLEFIDQLFPNAKRIWLVRNPLSIVASYKKVDAAQGNRFSLIENLHGSEFHIQTADVTIGLFRYLNYFTESHPQVYKLHYEKLAMHPRQELKALCAFLGISYEEGLEQYGDYMDSAKASMYFSMGAGDPLVTKHDRVHTDSIDDWKHILTKEEIRLYCQAVGAEIFHRLGYSDILFEAQKIAGTTFDKGPDMELLKRMTKQFNAQTGCTWQDNYKMQVAGTDDDKKPHLPAASSQSDRDAELMQLQITIQALDRRLQYSYNENKRLKKDYQSLRSKVDRLKLMFPNYIVRWGSRIAINRRQR